MIRISYKGFNRNLRLAVNNINNLLQQEYFYLGIRKHRYFDMCDITPSQLAELMRIAEFQMEVDLYYTLLPFSNTLVSDSKDTPTTIRLNKWNLNRPVESICNTLMHQCVHALNACYPQFHFGHGDNSNTGKENTAPYWIAALAQNYIAADNSLYEAMTPEDVTSLPFLQHFTDPVKKKPAYAMQVNR